MTRTITLWGYAVLAVLVIAYETFALLRRRTMTFGQFVTTLKRLPAGRPLLLAAWLWLGWHTFIRGTYE
jgi:hypothetical protein